MAKKNYNKHAVLAYLFDMKTNCGTQHIGEDIDFTLREVGEGIRATRRHYAHFAVKFCA